MGIILRLICIWVFSSSGTHFADTMAIHSSRAVIIVTNHAYPLLFKRLILMLNIWVDCGNTIEGLEFHHHWDYNVS